jgi:TIR domain/Protein of unknown function (DUF2628)
MAGHVFLSHGSENRDEAAALAAFIEGRGIPTWIAPRDVRPGMDYSEQLQEAIETCAAFVVLVTDHANTSPYVRAETEMAFSGSKPIFPVRLADIKPAAGLAFFLKIRHWTDAYGAGRDASLERLAQELQTLTGTAPQPGAALQPAAAPAASEPAAEDLRRAAIGPNADYFIGHWDAMAARKTAIDWSWAACLANIFWFVYRKMWVPMVVFIVASLLLSAMPLAGPLMAKASWLIFVGMSFVTGYFGNHLYRQQTDKLIAEGAGLEREARLAHLRARGGVSKAGLYTALGIFALLVALTVAGALIELNRRAAISAPAPVPAAAPAPAPAPEPGPAPASAPAPVALNQDYLIGRWADDGDCSRPSEFIADGRFVAQDGGVGNWRLDGNALTASGPAGAVVVQLTPIDQNRLQVVTADGQSAVSTRC